MHLLNFMLVFVWLAGRLISNPFVSLYDLLLLTALSLSLSSILSAISDYRQVLVVCDNKLFLGRLMLCFDPKTGFTCIALSFCVCFLVRSLSEDIKI